MQEAITDGLSNAHLRRIALATSQMRIDLVWFQHVAKLLSALHMPPELAITFDEVRVKNVEQLKTLNLAIFPIKYQVPQLTCLAFANAAHHYIT